MPEYYAALRARRLNAARFRVCAYRDLLDKCHKVVRLKTACSLHPQHYAVGLLDEKNNPLIFRNESLGNTCPIRLFLMKARVLIYFGGWQDWLATEPLKTILKEVNDEQ